MIEETIPEIQRTSLGHVILYLKSMGIHDVLGYINLYIVMYIYSKTKTRYVLTIHSMNKTTIKLLVRIACPQTIYFVLSLSRSQA